MPILLSDLAKKLDIAPEAITLHAMDLDFEIPEDEMISDEIAQEIKNLETGNELVQTEHEIQEQLDREIRDNQQKQTAGSFQKAKRKKQNEKVVEKKEIREEIEIKKEEDGTIILPEEMTVRELAVKISKPIPIVLIKMKQNGIIANLKENIDYETAAIIATELDVKVKKEAVELSGEDLFRADLSTLLQDEDPDNLQKRDPVVSIMGHVDHGKTSLLDYIRKTKITKDEAGGITQKIGAYQVNFRENLITFLDTPGHEAFTAMRARGAKATDIAILVVASNDGVKPQTIEAINHAKSAEIPIIVAINKSDLPEANADLVKKQLAENDLNPDDWGGEISCVEISSKTGKGIDDLLEIVLLTAENQNLKADPTRNAIGTVIESNLDAKSGISATILVNTGTLNKGDSFVIYDQSGKVRTMKDSHGKELKEAFPSTPVQIFGLSKLTKVGDILQVMKSEKIARKKAEEVSNIKHDDSLQKRKKASLATLKAKIAEGKMEQLKIIAKADSNGVLEAVVNEIAKIKTEKSIVKIIHSGVGAITESDIILASAGEAVVIGFNSAMPGQVKKIAEKEGVQVLAFDVIYHLTEKISEILENRENIIDEEKIVGEFFIKEIFASNKKMAVIGGDLKSGLVRPKLNFKLWRKNKESEDEDKEFAKIGEGKVETSQIGQKEEKEIKAEKECGLRISHKELVFEKGDKLEFFIPISKK